MSKGHWSKKACKERTLPELVEHIKRLNSLAEDIDIGLSKRLARERKNCRDQLLKYHGYK